MVEPKKPVRCAIYTRKSTEDGLEQEYNSLDAQYDACCAYALSQRHEGWTVGKERYDDSGFSGGNMNRPGLDQLLKEVKAGKVDIILLYKIDRLTRSMSDFTRIVDVLDAAGASFVSITQSFNTTTSMGRLTLNMLLSFAQFEREVTGERIRDKIAASKRKGLWLGGPVPLGYDVVERKLVPNVQEAKTVCHIMKRYVELGSVKTLVTELDAQGYRTKVQIRTSTANKGNRRYRYYITRSEQVDDKPAWRVNAYDLEYLVSQTIADLLREESKLLDVIGDKGFGAPTVSELFKRARFAASQLTGDATGARKDILELHKPSIALQNGCIDIAVGIQMLAAALGIAIDDCASRFFEMRCDAVRVRHGHEVRLVIADASNTVLSNCDTKLVALLAEAQAAAKLLTEHPGQSLSAIAKQQGRCRTRLGKLVELSCLAPDIITAIISGKQPVELNSKFLAATTIPMDWAGQRKLLGFPQTAKPQLQSEKVAVEIRL